MGIQSGSFSIDTALRAQEAGQAFVSHRPGSQALIQKTPDSGPGEKDLRILSASPTQSELRPPFRDRHNITSDTQEGFIVLDDGNGLTPQPNSSGANGVMAPYSHFLNVRGDEGERGPIFNYARLFTWTHLVGNVTRALESEVANIRAEKILQEELPDHVQGHVNGSSDPWVRFLEGSAEHTERYCGLDRFPLFAYPEWSEIALPNWKAIAIASFWAIFLQWGTTGTACRTP